MNIERCLKIIKSLANGIDPFTGEKYASGSPYQHPETVRALFRAVEGLQALQRRKEEQNPSTEGG